MRYITRYFKINILIIILSIGFDCFAQTNNNSKFLKGSDGFKSINCNDSCIIVYNDFDVITKVHKQSPGEDIIISNNKTRTRITINVGGEYNAQYFYGLYDRFAIIDYGTSAQRKIYIYDLDNKKIINSIDGGGEIINGKLHAWIVLSKDKIKKYKLKERQCLSEGCGFYEEINYNFKTNEVEFTGKYKWSQ